MKTLVSKLSRAGSVALLVATLMMGMSSVHAVTLLDEDFDNPPASGWVTRGPGSLTYPAVTPSGTGYSANLAFGGTGGPEQYGFSHALSQTFDVDSGLILSLEFDIRIVTSTFQTTVRLTNDSFVSPIVINFMGDKTVAVTNGTAGNPDGLSFFSGTYDSDSWYHVTAVFDSANSTTTFSISGNGVNGTLSDRTVAPVRLVDLTRFDAFVVGSSATPSNNFYIDNISVTAVPEPSTWALVAGGLIFLMIRRRRASSRNC